MITKHSNITNATSSRFSEFDKDRLFFRKGIISSIVLGSAIGFSPISISHALADETVLDITIAKESEVSQNQVAFVPFSGDRNLSSAIFNDLLTTSLKITDQNLIQQAHSSQEVLSTLPAWQQVGLSFVVVGNIQNNRGNSVANYQIVDVDSGRVLANENVVATSQSALVHKTSARIYEVITGKPSDLDARIAYVEQTGNGASLVSKLMIRNADGSNPRVLATIPRALIFRPAASPDGRYLAFSVQHENNNPKLFKLDLLNGSYFELATNIKHSKLGPAFTRDGNTIVFSSNADGNGQHDIYHASAYGGPAQKIFEKPYDQVQPSVNPLDNSFVFASDHASPKNPSIYRFNGANNIQLLHSGNAADPNYSPDGTKIGYLNGRSAAIMDNNGKNILTIGNTGIDEAPRFSPSSERVVYAQGKGRSTIVVRSLEGGKTISFTANGNVKSPTWVPRAK